jgi:hypothetical protein
MQLTAFDGITFASLGVTCSLDPSSPGPSRSLPSVGRFGGDPIAPGIEQDVHDITAVFNASGLSNYVEVSFSKLFAVLNPDSEKPRILAGTILTTGPSTTTAVQTYAYVGNWRYRSVNQLEVQFIVTTPGWKQTSSTTLKAAGAISADSSFANANTAMRDVAPIITLYGTGLRASSTATFGWNYRIGSGTTVTNSGTEPLRNQPYQLGPIDTKTIVAAGRMQADGDDLRVFCEGVELRRNIIGPNTLATLIWIVLPDLMPGQAIILDLITGNSSATNPPTFSYTSDPPLPAMDISGTSFSPTSSAATTATLTGAGWETDQWAGATVVLMRSGGSVFDTVRRVISNNATTITVDRSWSPTPGGSDTVTITKSGITGTGGTITSATATTVTDTVQSWNTNEWVGASFKSPTGTITGTITSNTATVLTGTFSGTPTALANYTIYRANGQRVWDVRQVKKATPHNGLWLTNKSETPPTGRNFDAPGSWYRFAYNRNDDAYSQPSYTTVDVGDDDHFPIMNIRRAREGKGGDQTEVGVADAIGVSSPFPILGIEMEYQIRNAKKAGSNPAAGMAEVRFMQQDSGGEVWASFHSDTDVHDTTTAVANAWYNLSASQPNRLAIALIPNGGDEIPENDNNTAQLQSQGEYVRLAVNPTSSITESVAWFTATPSTVAVYDVDLKIRRGGASATRPYYRIRIGGTGRRVFLPTDGSERILVDAERHAVELVNSSAVFIRSLSYAAVAQEVVIGSDGVERILVAGRWLPIPPTTVDSAAIYYRDDSGAGWGTMNLAVVGTLGYWT